LLEALISEQRRRHMTQAELAQLLGIHVAGMPVVAGGWRTSWLVLAASFLDPEDLQP
jgi:hypothetical protein